MVIYFIFFVFARTITVRIKLVAPGFVTELVEACNEGSFSLSCALLSFAIPLHIKQVGGFSICFHLCTGNRAA